MALGYIQVQLVLYLLDVGRSGRGGSAVLWVWLQLGAFLFLVTR